MTTWRTRAIDQIRDTDIYRLANSIVKTVTSTVPHQNSQQNFFPQKQTHVETRVVTKSPGSTRISEQLISMKIYKINKLVKVE